MATTKVWTVEEVAALPDDEFRYALIRGALFRSPPRVASQGRCVAAVGRHVGNFVRAHDLGLVVGPCGFVLGHNPDTLLEPDVAFVQRDRVPEDLAAYPEMAPDIAVEVVAPSPTGPSIEEKVAHYLAAGASLVWVVDPTRRAVGVCRQDEAEQPLSEWDELDGEDVLPGFRLPISQLFA